MTIAPPLTEAAFMDQGCSVPDCGKSQQARALCSMHLSRLYRRGDVGGPGPQRLRGDTEERFWGRVAKSEGCWVWTGLLSHGYGTFTEPPPDGGKHIRVLAHRWAYLRLVGPIPVGLELDHLCRNPRCVRPDHLEPVTHRENCRRGLAGGHAQRKRTHCPKGHPYSGANLNIRREGGRICRECDRVHAREYQRRKRALA